MFHDRGLIIEELHTSLSSIICLSICKYLSVHPSLYFYHPSVCLSMSIIYLSTYPICLSIYVVFSRSVTSSSATPWTAAHQASLSFTISQSLLQLMSIESVMPSNHLILYHPLLLPPSIFPSIRMLSNESLFTSGSQSIGASASVLSRNIQD